MTQLEFFDNPKRRSYRLKEVCSLIKQKRAIIYSMEKQIRKLESERDILFEILEGGKNETINNRN